MSHHMKPGGCPPSRSCGRTIDSVVKVESLSQGVTFQDNSTLLESDYPTNYHEVKQNYQVPSDGRVDLDFRQTLTKPRSVRYFFNFDVKIK